MPYLTVSNRRPHRFEVRVEGQRLTVDEGGAVDGRDSGPTPTELLAASLASCAAAYAEAYLVAHSYPAYGLAVACHYQLTQELPPRVATMNVTVTAPVSLPVERRRALLKAVEQCLIGKTLRVPPVIKVIIAEPEQIA